MILRTLTMIYVAYYKIQVQRGETEVIEQLNK